MNLRYNNLTSPKQGRLGRVLLILIMMVMGVGSAWGQSASVWNGTVATKFASGSGTQTAPYIISNAAELAYFGSQMNGKTYYVKLTTDIDLGGKEWPYSGNTAKTFKGHFDGDGHTVSNFTITAVSNKANALIGTISGTAKDNRAEVKNLNISGVTISNSTNLAATTYIGALAGNVSQYADIVNVNVSDVAISVANLTGANYHGGLAGRLQKNSTVNHCSVTGVSITLGGNITGACYVGGAVGSLDSEAGDDSSITRCSASGTIKTDGSHTLNYNLTNAFGGVVGYVDQSTTKFSEVKQCTSEVDFNLSGLTPATVSGSNYNMYRSGFVVGGVIGRINTPSRLPEHLFYSGKIYAPFAAAGPIVGVFNTNLNAAAYVYDDYSGVNATAISVSEWKKEETWYYSGYKLGLSSDVLSQTAKNRNYNGSPSSEDGVNYLAIEDGTFKAWNTISSVSKLSTTVLAYTADKNTGKTGISPQWNNNESTYPAYYMYFMQGVNRGMYKPTDTKKMMRLFASKGAYPKVEVDGDDTSGYEFAVDLGELATDANYTVTCQWYNSDKSSTIGTGNSLSMTKSELDAAGGVVNCEITVSGTDFAAASITLQGTDKIVVFIDGTNGKDNVIGSRSRGWTPATAVKTIDHANSLLDGGPWDKNYIVVIGDLNNSGNLFQSRGRNPATITGKWGGTDYEGVIRFKKGSESAANPGDGPGKTGYHNYVSADTKFEYLTLYCTNTGSSIGNIDNCFFECHGHDVWFGKGIKMYGFRRLSAAHGNLEDRFVTPEFSVILTATNLAPANVEDYWTRTKPQTLTIESGHYGRILGGRFTSGYFGSSPTHVIQATAKHPSWAVINIDIDPENEMTGTEYVLGHSGPDNPVTYTNDVTCVVAGLTDGTIYGDYIINLHGGTIGYVIGANQGNAVKNGSKTFTPLGGKSGDFGHWPNASYFGRTIINVDERDGLKPLTLENLYAGGLGRDAGSENTKSVVDLYVYGHTEINMKKGTVTGNIYGGGAGGVIGMNPWDPRVPYATTDANSANNAIYQGVQYGTWGSKQAGSPLADVILHKIDDDGNYTSETEALNLANSSTTINMSGGTVGGNVYGGGDGYVSVMVPNITMQGVGSVFGTSTLNISGGTINGSVYGGSQGNEKYFNGKNAYGQTITHIAEMNGTVNLNITGTDDLWPTIGGNIYGGGQGIASTSTQEYLDIARAGNSSLGEQYKTDINITIDLPESHPFLGNVYGGGEMGAVDGTTNVVINGGVLGQVVDANVVNGNVFGGGKGEPGHPDKAKVTGTTHVNIDAGSTDIVMGDVYGGGELAQVVGETRVDITSGPVRGDVYGGGSLANVDGNTVVNLNGGSIGSAYGGGLGAKTGINGATADVAALVTGNTTVTLDGSIVNGYIFGCNNLNGTPKGHAFVDIKTTKAKGTETQEHPYHVLGVYGGGNLAAYVPTDANEKTEVLIEHCANSIEDVFGGGNAASVPATDVTVWGGNLGRVFAGGNGATAPANVTNNTHVTIHGGTIKEVYGGSNTAGDIGGTIYVDVAEQKYLENDLCPVNVDDLYGGGNLAASKAGHISIGKCTLIDRVFGGANNANVSGDITLNINEGHINNVFGGNNNGGNINGNITVNVDWNDGVTTENAKVGNVYGGGNIAAIDNAEQKSITVNIINATTSGSVFGGGKGKTAVVKADTKVNIGDWNDSHHAVVTGDVFGGGDLAAVEGVTAVNIRDCGTLITGDLYGGGNAAPVFETNTTVWGGTIAGNLFGGGNGVNLDPTTGNPNGAQVGYKRDDTATGGTGNANTNLYGGTIGTWNGTDCTAGGSVFGGSNSNGNIRNHINLTVNEQKSTETGSSLCSLKFKEIYGAGNEAAYAGTGIAFNLGCVSELGEIYGGAKAADLNADAILTITSGHFGKVFGGNNVSGKLNGKIVVNIDETGCNPVIIDELYGGGNLAAYSVYGYEDNGAVKTSGTKLYADPQVNIISCTQIDNVYGGGYGESAVMVGNPTVTINQILGRPNGVESETLGAIGTVFGGGNAAKVIGSTTVNVGTATTKVKHISGDDQTTEYDAGANVTGNVYGGGNQADVTGKTNVIVGRETVTP